MSSLEMSSLLASFTHNHDEDQDDMLMDLSVSNEAVETPFSTSVNNISLSLDATTSSNSSTCSEQFTECPSRTISPLSVSSSNLLAPVSSNNIKMAILGIPEEGGRSRIETQIRLVIHLEQSLPTYRVLHLPAHLMANRTVGHEQVPNDHQALQVRARVVNHDESATIYSCYSCIMRERKRRTRIKNVARKTNENEDDNSSNISGNSDSSISDGSLPSLVNIHQTEEDRERILLFFNKSRVAPLLRGDALIPIRLTCYSRHHKDHFGFRVHIDLLDYTNRLVASASSNLIFITDDHKRTTKSSTNAMPIPQQFPVSASLASCIPRSIDSPKLPIVSKVCPSEGPMYGGIEVTVIGENFTPSSIILFGSLPARVLSYIGTTTVIVLLPPAIEAGPVLVSTSTEPIPVVKSLDLENCSIASRINSPSPIMSLPSIASPKSSSSTSSAALLGSQTSRPSNQVFFHYKNDLDNAMMELALQLIGMKMTGRIDDARDVAMRIINDLTPSLGNQSSTQQTLGGALSKSALYVMSREYHPLGSIEQTILTCLVASTVCFNGKSSSCPFTAKQLQAVRTAGGQTLLHLAALAQFDSLFEYLALIECGVTVYDVDNNHFTPIDLHYLAGRRNLVDRLGFSDFESESLFAHISRFQQRTSSTCSQIDFDESPLLSTSQQSSSAYSSDCGGDPLAINQFLARFYFVSKRSQQRRTQPGFRFVKSASILSTITAYFLTIFYPISSGESLADQMTVAIEGDDDLASISKHGKQGANSSSASSRRTQLAEQLRHLIWRKFSSNQSKNQYYLKLVGLHPLQMHAQSLQSASKNKTSSKQLRYRDLTLYFFWIPIVAAAIYLWICNFYTDSPSPTSNATTLDSASQMSTFA